jgi:hypothetical protein
MPDMRTTLNSKKTLAAVTLSIGGLHGLEARAGDPVRQLGQASEIRPQVARSLISAPYMTSKPL